MTTPTANNRKPIASSKDGTASSIPGPSHPAESVERGIGARLQSMGLGVQIQPLKEMRLQVGLDIQVVYCTIRVPFVGGVTLRWPVVATLLPSLYSPTRAQHLS
jgi:hypothetical protein